MKNIKLALLIAIMLVGLRTAAEAQMSMARRISPRNVVVNLYSQHKRRSPFFQTRNRALVDRYFSKELADLIWEDARSSGDEVGALDGDPLFNAQDMQIKNFAIREGTVGAQAAQVLVTFRNFGKPHQLDFRLVPAGVTWKIADIAYDDGASLLGILTRDRADVSQQVKVYLIALDDNGKAGKKIGCDDSVVAVTRTIKKTTAPLSAALTQLLLTPPHPAETPKLENFWKGENLRLRSVAINNFTATIRLSGDVFVAGICDIPRIESQIEETAKQFPNVKRVKVFIGNQTLRNAIR